MRIDVDLRELEQAASEYAEQVSEAVSTDAETAAYVEELEQRVDSARSEATSPRASRSPPNCPASLL